MCLENNIFSEDSIPRFFTFLVYTSYKILRTVKRMDFTLIIRLS